MAKTKTANNATETKEEEHKELTEKKLTIEERECLANHHERSKRKPLKFTNTTESGTPSITPKDVSKDVFFDKMTEALGTADFDLQNYLLNQVIKVFRGFASREGYNYENMAVFSNAAMAILNGIQPQDEIEGMLVVQMI